jgi:hypothetical protein
VLRQPISNVVGSLPALPPSVLMSCQLQNGAGIVLHFATHVPLLCVLVKKTRTSPPPELTIPIGTVST